MFLEIVYAFTYPFRKGKFRSFIIGCVFSILPLLIFITTAIAFSRDTEDQKSRGIRYILISAVKMAVTSILLLSPAAMYYMIFSLVTEALNIYNIYLLSAIFIIFLSSVISACLRLPAALCHISSGGSIKEALDKRTIKILMSAKIGQYIISLLCLVPIAFLGSLLDYLPFWLSLIIGAILATYGQFVAGYLFNVTYTNSRNRMGASLSHHRRALKAVSAALIVSLLTCQPASVLAVTEDELYTNEATYPKGYGSEDERAKAEDDFIRSGALNKYTEMRYDNQTGRYYVVKKADAGLNPNEEFVVGVADVVTDLIPVVSNIKDAIQWNYYRKLSNDTSKSKEERDYARKMMWYKGITVAVGPAASLAKYAKLVNGGVVLHIAQRMNPLVEATEKGFWYWDRVGNVGTLAGGTIAEYSPGAIMGEGKIKVKEYDDPKSAIEKLELYGTYKGLMHVPMSGIKVYGSNVEINDPELEAAVDKKGNLSLRYIFKSTYEFEMAGVKSKTVSTTQVMVSDIPLDYSDASYEKEFTVDTVMNTQAWYEGEAYEGGGGNINSSTPAKVTIKVKLALLEYGGKKQPMLFGSATHKVEAQTDTNAAAQTVPASMEIQFEVPRVDASEVLIENPALSGE